MRPRKELKRGVKGINLRKRNVCYIAIERGER